MLYEWKLFNFGKNDEYGYYVYKEDGEIKYIRVPKKKVETVKTIDSLTSEVRKLKDRLSIQNTMSLDEIRGCLFHKSNTRDENHFAFKVFTLISRRMNR